MTTFNEDMPNESRFIDSMPSESPSSKDMPNKSPFSEAMPNESQLSEDLQNESGLIDDMPHESHFSEDLPNDSFKDGSMSTDSVNFKSLTEPHLPNLRDINNECRICTEKDSIKKETGITKHSTDGLENIEVKYMVSQENDLAEDDSELIDLIECPGSNEGLLPNENEKSDNEDYEFLLILPPETESVQYQTFIKKRATLVVSTADYEQQMIKTQMHMANQTNVIYLPDYKVNSGENEHADEKTECSTDEENSGDLNDHMIRDLMKSGESNNEGLVYGDQYVTSIEQNSDNIVENNCPDVGTKENYDVVEDRCNLFEHDIDEKFEEFSNNDTDNETNPKIIDKPEDNEDDEVYNAVMDEFVEDYEGDPREDTETGFENHEEENFDVHRFAKKVMINLESIV